MNIMNPNEVRISKAINGTIDYKEFQHLAAKARSEVFISIFTRLKVNNKSSSFTRGMFHTVLAAH